MGLRRDVKDGVLSRNEVKALLANPDMSPRFRDWVGRWLARNPTTPRGNRAELDVGPGPRGAKTKRKRNSAKVSKRKSR